MADAAANRALASSGLLPMASIIGLQYRSGTDMSIREVISLALQLSLIAIVFSVGLQSRGSDVAYILRRPPLLLRAIVAVDVIVPAVAVGLCLILSVAPSTRAGLVLMAASPLAVTAPLKMLRTHSERAYVVGTYAAVMLATVVTIPATAEILRLISPHAFKVPVAVVAAFALTKVLLPLLLGVAVHEKWPGFSERVAPDVQKVGIVIFVAIGLLVLFRFARDFLVLVGDGSVIVIVATIVAGLVAGHALGGPNPANRRALGEAAATRHPSLAVAIAQANPQFPRVIASIMLFQFCSILFSLSVLQLRSVLDARRSHRKSLNQQRL